MIHGGILLPRSHFGLKFVTPIMYEYVNLCELINNNEWFSEVILSIGSSIRPSKALKVVCVVHTMTDKISWVMLGQLIQLILSLLTYSFFSIRSLQSGSYKKTFIKKWFRWLSCYLEEWFLQIDLLFTEV